MDTLFLTIYLAPFVMLAIKIGSMFSLWVLLCALVKLVRALTTTVHGYNAKNARRNRYYQ